MAKPTRQDKRTEKSANDSKPIQNTISKGSWPVPKWYNMWILFFALAMVLYGNTLQNGYSLDDELVTLDQPNVERGFSGIPDIFTSRYSVNAKQNYEYRPLVLVTFALEYQFFERNPAASHFFNIVLYSLLCLVIFLLVKKIFDKQHWLLAFISALLFLIHPVHNEVVASLKNRDEILSLLFALTAFYQILIYTERKRLPHLIFGLLCILFVMLSKKSGVMFILLIPFLLIYLKRIQIRTGVVLLVLLFISGIVLYRVIVSSFFAPQGLARETFYFENPLYVGKYSMLVKLNYAIGTFGFYICKYILPYPLLSYYGYNVFNGFGFGFYHVVGVAAAIGILIALVRFWKKDEILVTGLILFGASQAIFLNFPMPAPGIVAERFMFASSLGLSILLAWLLMGVFNLRTATLSWSLIPSKLKYALVGLFILYAIIIIPRNTAWFSTQSLYKADTKVEKSSAKLYSLLGTIYATRLNNHNLGIEQLSQLDIKLNTDSAIASFRNAIRVYPKYPSVNNNLGTMYFTYRQNNDSAGYFFKKAVENDSDYVEAYFNLANYYENCAGLQNEKHNWLRYYAAQTTNADSLRVKTSSGEVEKLEKANNVFFRLYVLKSLMIQVYKNTAMGRSKANPRDVINNLWSGYAGLMPEVAEKWPKGEEAVEQIINTFKSIRSNGNERTLESAVDSVVNKITSPTLKAYLTSDLNISLENSYALAKAVQQKVEIEKQNTINCCLKALHIKPNYYQVYGKLNPLLLKWKLYSTAIEINEFLLKSGQYKESSLEFALAEAYFYKGDFKAGASTLLTALTDLKQVVSRTRMVAGQMIAASNNLSAAKLQEMEQLNLNNASYYLNNMKPFLENTAISGEAIRIKEIFNSIAK